MMENHESSAEEEDLPDNKSTPGKEGKNRHTWIKGEVILLLRLWRHQEGWKVPTKDRGPLWVSFKTDLKKQNLHVSARAIRDRINKTINTFRTNNPKNERKTGDPEEGTFDEEEKLLLEICGLENEWKQRGKSGRTAADEKRERAEEKLMIAAKHGLKKRAEAEKHAGKSEKKKVPVSPKKRASWQSEVSKFFKKKAVDQDKQADQKAQKLEIERDKLRLEEKKLDLEAKRQAEAAKDQEAARKEREIMLSIMQKALGKLG